MSEFLYRFEESAMWEDSAMVVYLYQFRVVRKTPSGCWIEPNGYNTDGGWRNRTDRNKPRFVLDGARKKHAFPTIEEARKSFIARKGSQLAHLARQSDFAQAALDIALRGDFVPNKSFRHERLKGYQPL